MLSSMDFSRAPKMMPALFQIQALGRADRKALNIVRHLRDNHIPQSQFFGQRPHHGQNHVKGKKRFQT